jgi:hypothetical protein
VRRTVYATKALPCPDALISVPLALISGSKNDVASRGGRFLDRDALDRRKPNQLYRVVFIRENEIVLALADVSKVAMLNEELAAAHQVHRKRRILVQ